MTILLSSAALLFGGGVVLLVTVLRLVSWDNGRSDTVATPSAPSRFARDAVLDETLMTIALDETTRTLEYQERRLQNVRTRSALAVTAVTAATSFFASEAFDAGARPVWIGTGIALSAVVMAVGVVPVAPLFKFEFIADPAWYVEQLVRRRERGEVVVDILNYWHQRIVEHQAAHRRMSRWLNAAFLGLVLVVVYWGAVVLCAPGPALEETP